MTPGTTNKGRKTVSFGSQVMDNEGKRGNTGKSGIPNDCPGKFPSPWTPGTQLKLDPTSDKRPRNKLTEALLDARTTTQSNLGPKPRARDDTDITIDMSAPRSESGKYWKEQYENYAARSEKEMKKVIAKQQLAKKFAIKKDGEVTELTTKLEQERKRFRQRERDLEQQNKDYQERLRQAMADNASSSIEAAALKARVATLERSASISLPEPQHNSKPSFNIYEDSSKSRSRQTQKPELEASFIPPPSMTTGKENASPTPQRPRRQTVPDALARPSLPTRLGTDEGEVSIVLGKSPRATDPFSEQTRTAPSTEIPTKSPLNSRKWESLNENAPPSSPLIVLPSSPLPVSSPDPWLGAEASSILQVDKMALPLSTGMLCSRPEWNPPPKQHQSSKSTSNSRQAIAAMKDKPRDSSDITQGLGSTYTIGAGRTTKKAVQEDARAFAASRTTSRTGSTSDSKFNVSKITAHHAEGSAQIKHDRAEILPVDRKAEARRRLEARKKLRKNCPA